MENEQLLNETAEQPAEPAAVSLEYELEAGEKETAPAAQSRQENAKFAAMRRQQEANAAAFKRLVGDIANPETGKPFESEAEFIAFKQQAAMAAAAKSANLQPKAYQQVMEKVTRPIKQTDPDFLSVQQELAQYKEKDRQQTFETDLRAIKDAFPDEKAQSVTELGDDFLRLCAFGVDPAVAYRAVRQHKAQTEKTPPSTGDVGGAGKEKEFFTREEVRRMSQKEIHKNYDKIKRSQTRWDDTKG